MIFLVMIAILVGLIYPTTSIYTMCFVYGLMVLAPAIYRDD